MKLTRMTIMTALATALLPMAANAQQALTLEECRDLAVMNNKELKIAEQQIKIAGYDRKIALANYLPNISATAGYMYNSHNLSLISKDASDFLTGTGTNLQEALQDKLTGILSDPNIGQLVASSPELQALVGQLKGIDIATPINKIGNEINDAFAIDIEHVFAGVISLQQPVFMGGKIVAANRIAKLAEDLAKDKYDMAYQDVIINVDQAYWQIVSVAGKVRLAEAYADLLHQMEHDVEIMIAEGVATESDALTVKVKANEADMLLTKARNGMVLSKMLLCKLCGMELGSEITLADENIEKFPMAQIAPYGSMDDVFNARPEIRSLNTASEIYRKKVAVTRADMMPHIALTANYFVTNPNLRHGWSTTWDDMFNVGVMVKIPIIHGCETMNKVRKAKAEAALTQFRLDDAKEKITLQVTQCREQESEAIEKLIMAESNLASAEDNMRTATIGFTEGVVTTNTVIQAQTAWLKAHSEYIEAGVELQICEVSRRKAEGRFQHGTACEMR
ncbi:MAG: TolC family protein [Bacteroides sp.]|nr:TolC family protein [Bacteroides sp.]